MCAVTTRTEAIPRRPWEAMSVGSHGLLQWVRREYRHLPRQHLALVLGEVASRRRLRAEIRLRPSIRSLNYRGYKLKCSEW